VPEKARYPVRNNTEFNALNNVFQYEISFIFGTSQTFKLEVLMIKQLITFVQNSSVEKIRNASVFAFIILLLTLSPVLQAYMIN
jgi:hypothetical protein